jgi:hypothetical protein
VRGGAGVALAGLLAASCAGGGDSDAGSAPPAGRPVVCAPPAKGVPGYVLVRRRDVPFADHIGLRLEFRDPRGRRLYLLMGIPGGVGEGLPLRSTPAVAGDAAARFLGRDDRWVLAWDGPDPCEDMAVVGNDLSRPHFRRVLRSMGIWCDRSVSGGCHDGGA